jgi:lipid-A-disaccharide synthase
MHRPRIYIITGEASGDLHGSNLMRALKTQSDDGVDLRFWGGDRMADQGGELVKHIRDLAFMGFAEVLLNLRTILHNLDFCKKDVLMFKPDLLVLIDYPGFNLRIAEWAKKNKINVAYYISPQIWAWKESRVKKIKRSVDHMYVILPFEKTFYQRHGMEVEYVGHPLLDAINAYNSEGNRSELIRSELGVVGKKVIAVLPGSRKQEISVKLPIMLKALEQFKDHEILVAAAPSIEPSFYAPYLSVKDHLIKGRTYDILSIADAAIVTSGTATLETALFGIPQVVCYKGSPISYQIAKRLVKIRFISLVNLILDREVVTELIQHNCNPERISEELSKLLGDTNERKKMLQEFSELRQILGEGGASAKVARSLLKTIQELS